MDQAIQCNTEEKKGCYVVPSFEGSGEKQNYITEAWWANLYKVQYEGNTEEEVLVVPG